MEYTESKKIKNKKDPTKNNLFNRVIFRTQVLPIRRLFVQEIKNKNCKHKTDRLNTYSFWGRLFNVKSYSNRAPRFKMGPIMQKALLLMEGGLVLGLTRRPDAYFKILKKMSKEWQKINERALRSAIRKLYQSKLIDYKENNDGTVSMTLTSSGKKKIVRFNLDSMKIKKPRYWDHLWRLVIFDIPEEERQGRRALAAKLKELGFYPMQKSAFIYPFECKNEIDFVTEIFNLRPYVRFFTVKETDIEADLRNRFNI